MSLASDLELLFRRDLNRFHQQIEAFPDEESLWRRLPGVTNPAGNLVLHLEGNLRDFIGRMLGGITYERKRDLEFSAKDVGKRELLARLAQLLETIPPILGKLSTDQLEAEYPKVVLEMPLSTQAFLVHLSGHLNWHLGQVDYLRRALTGDGAIKSAGLK